MFASHLAPPLQQSLVSHVFGRFLARAPQSSPAVPAAPDVPAVSVALEAEEPDLAQRVRELGEW